MPSASHCTATSCHIPLVLWLVVVLPLVTPLPSVCRRLCPSTCCVCWCLCLTFSGATTSCCAILVGCWLLHTAVVPCPGHTATTWVAVWQQRWWGGTVIVLIVVGPSSLSIDYACNLLSKTLAPSFKNPGSICCLGYCQSLTCPLHLHWLVVVSDFVASPASPVLLYSHTLILAASEIAAASWCTVTSASQLPLVCPGRLLHCF